MDKLTEGERLIALETKMNTVLDNQKAQANDFKELSKTLGDLLPSYATRAELEMLKKRNTLQTWLVGTLSAGFGVVMTVLIQSYFSK